VEQLEAALTTFPRARTLRLWDHSDELFDDCDDEDYDELVEWLREEGGGRRLAAVSLQSDAAIRIIHAALQEGALPSLRGVDAGLWLEAARASLTQGFLGALHELRVTLNCSDEPQLAALGLVRELPALAKLDVSVVRSDRFPVQWPYFIPPSLKSLFLDVTAGALAPRLLPHLPGMLGASGARLERLQLFLPCDFRGVDDVTLGHVAQTLGFCSPTLEGFYLGTPSDWVWIEGEQDYAGQVEELRLVWADVLAGVSACRELQVLVLPDIGMESLFPPGTAFRRLTELKTIDYAREHPPEAGVMGLWELVASGGLPALVKLSVELKGRWGGVEEVRSRVAPAFEAVAGTLMHLNLAKPGHGKWSSDELEMGYELGVAVGKLRRLKDLALELSHDGQFYQTLAQGLAAGGGHPPLPLLWRLTVFSSVKDNTDLLASLLLPSVRVFGSVSSFDVRVSFLIACALQAGYKHILVGDEDAKYMLGDIVRVVAPCTTYGDTHLDERHTGWCKTVEDEH
jgi:hypothetical protein